MTKIVAQALSSALAGVLLDRWELPYQGRVERLVTTTSPFEYSLSRKSKVGRGSWLAQGFTILMEVQTPFRPGTWSR